MRHHFRSILAWAGTRGALVLSVILAIVGGTWIFILLADRVNEGKTQRFDDWAIRALRRKDDPSKTIGSSGLLEIGRDLTAMGGVTVLGLTTLAVAAYLGMARKFHAMWLVIVASFGGFAVSSLLKYTIARDRPQLVPHLSMVYTSSFPSGHSMMSAVVYLTLGSLLMRLAPGRVMKIYFLGVALLVTFLVGVSRVYMGVHYPTDVLAGWTAGLVRALICWLVARYLQRRRIVEDDDAETARFE